MSIDERPQVLLDHLAPVRVSAVVAIPVRNERDRVAACLDALAAQVGILPGSFGLLLFLNNCTDDTREIVDAWARASPWPIRLLEKDCATGSAGWARRMAMEAAAEWLEGAGSAQDGTLLTTDADSRVEADWVARNLTALANADAVAGRVAFEATDLARLPDVLRERLTLEAAYEALLAEIDARLDPQPGNPWPSHWTKSGATIALRLSAYRRIGGLPRRVSGEDHALIDAVRDHGLVVRHDPTIVVVTSGRLEGRACGGVADALRLRGEMPDTACDPRLERLDRVLRRVLLRRVMRRRRNGPNPRRTDLPYQPLQPAQLPRQVRHARLFLGLIRQFAPRRRSRRYSLVRELRTLVDHASAARRKWLDASSPLKG